MTRPALPPYRNEDPYGEVGDGHEAWDEAEPRRADPNRPGREPVPMTLFEGSIATAIVLLAVGYGTLRRALMKTEEEFNAKVDELAAAATAEKAEVNTALDALAAEIQALKDEIANAPGPDFEGAFAKVDSALAEVKGIVTPPEPTP
jgi:hypothetical protein